METTSPEAARLLLSDSPSYVPRGRKQSAPSPLVALLGSISLYSRCQIQHVRLRPDLGYQCQLNFGNAELLYRWLTAKAAVSGWSPRAMRVKEFYTPITLAALLAHASSYPVSLLMNDGSRLPVPNQPRRRSQS